MQDVGERAVRTQAHVDRRGRLTAYTSNLQTAPDRPAMPASDWAYLSPLEVSDTPIMCRTSVPQAADSRRCNNNKSPFALLRPRKKIWVSVLRLIAMHTEMPYRSSIVGSRADTSFTEGIWWQTSHTMPTCLWESHTLASRRHAPIPCHARTPAVLRELRCRNGR